MIPGNTRSRLRRMKRRVLAGLGRPSDFSKTDLIDVIAKRFGCVHYLELCTQTTGNYYREINHRQFKSTRRLMYNCPVTFDDGLPIDFRIADFDIADAIGALNKSPDKIDICLVDGWHTYECAARDLNSAYDSLAEGGALVVHDCLPPNEQVASPTPIVGEWCGVSYKAFLDFVLDRDDLDYCTVDIDYGCGVIFKRRIIDSQLLPSAKPDLKLVNGWLDVQADAAAAFDFFRKNHVALLRLISPKAFLRVINNRTVRPAPTERASTMQETPRVAASP